MLLKWARIYKIRKTEVAGMMNIDFDDDEVEAVFVLMLKDDVGVLKSTESDDDDTEGVCVLMSTIELWVVVGVSPSIILLGGLVFSWALGGRTTSGKSPDDKYISRGPP